MILHGVGAYVCRSVSASAEEAGKVEGSKPSPLLQLSYSSVSLGLQASFEGYMVHDRRSVCKRMLVFA
jgi:hypothetical protein